jgi:hypothetical protein
MSEIMNDDLGIYAFINIIANTGDRRHLEGIYLLISKKIAPKTIVEWLIL